MNTTHTATNTATKTNVTARGVLLETIIEKADLFRNPEMWVSVQDFREQVMHRYDLERMQLAYSTPTEATQALIHALESYPWIETRGSGIHTEFRVKHFPNTLPRNLNDALAEVKQLRSVLAKWKDVGQQMLDLTSGVHALRLALKNNEDLLFRAAALAFFYRSRLVEFCKARDLSFDDIDPNPMLLEAIVADPSKFAEVKVMTKAFGLLTDEALENAVEEASE